LDPFESYGENEALQIKEYFSIRVFVPNGLLSIQFFFLKFTSNNQIYKMYSVIQSDLQFQITIFQIK